MVPARTVTVLLFAACAFPCAASANALDDALVRIDGAPGDRAGARVEHAGDVNADGRPDVVIAAPGVDTAAGEDAGAAYVVFGRAAPASIALGALGAGGFRIAHATPGTPDEPVAIGVDVAGAGDFNGDGRDDIVVGVRGADDSAYVVFGKASSTAVDLSNLGTAGVRIRHAGLHHVRFSGNSHGAIFGWQVDGAGDVNGDGLGDVVLGGPALRHADPADAGAAVVVFGRRGTQDVDVSALGARGFKVFGGHGICCEGAVFGATVAGAGDVNGDGRGDVLVGTSDALYAGIPGEYASSSHVDVIYGKATTTAVDADAGGSGVLRIENGPGDGCFCAQFSGDGFAEHLDGVGDITGDNRADIGLGAPAYGDPQAGYTDGAAGAAWVLFGRSGGATVDLLARPSGLWLTGRHGDAMGRAFAGSVDLDSDGASRDVAVLGGMFPRFEGNDRLRIFIQHGPIPSTAQTIDRSELTGGSGQVLDAGAFTYEADLDGVHDFTGDGRDELVLGRATDRDGAGSVYLLQEPVPACTITGTARAETLTGTAGADVICARAGDDVVNGQGGADTVFGGRGNDRVTGGLGADRLFGDLGNDRLTGGDGDDRLTGGPGADYLDGGVGNDTGHGGAGRDVQLGGAGTDRLLSEDGGGTLNGGGGNDVLLTRDPDPQAESSDAGNQTLVGGDGDDQLIAGSGRDLLNGGIGADVLEGGLSADRLYGTGGPDTLDGGLGPDLLVGGDGADSLSDGPEWLPPQFDVEVTDTFQCGTAFDRAFGTGTDRISGDCEDVTLQ